MTKYFPLLFFALSLSLAACEEEQSHPEQGPDTLKTQTDPLSPADSFPLPADLSQSEIDSLNASKYIEGDFTVQKAMEVVYGYYDKDMECSKWICTVPEKAQFQDKFGPGGKLHTRAAGVYDFKTAQGSQKILITETLSRDKDDWESCHACAPILGAAIFTQIDNDWFIMALRKNMGTYGAWGKGPESELVKIGKDHYGIFLEESYTAQGITDGSHVLLGLAADSFKVLLDIPSSYSNEGMYYEDFHPELAEAWDSDFKFVPQGGADYYDLIVTQSGKRLTETDQGEKVIPFTEKKHFTFENGKYVQGLNM